MKKKYTIRDIASISGVSIGTVDRVIHNRGKVSKDASDRVNAAIKEFDYRPNPIARTLKNNIVYRIDLLIPNPDKDSYWKPCIDRVNGVISEFSTFDIEVNIRFFDPSSSLSFVRIGNQIWRNNPNAILLVPLFERETDKLITKCKESNIFVGTFNSLPKVDIGVHVGQNLFLSGRVAARLIHTTVTNCSKIVIAHVDESYNNAAHMREKERGFMSYFNEKENTDIPVLKLNRDEFHSGFKSFINDHPDIEAIFVTTSKAYKVVKELHTLNKQDIVIVGYDLLDENVRYLEQGDISFLIHQNPGKQASLGLRYLINKLLFNKQIPEQRLLPIDIINSENVVSYISD
ncbi:substrate-binding domain-containing protein [Aquimarina sediminis]|uniref:substrate-binding domain-containing protein n=1 Tax=Aquimarina sediminis TaxID=2070536 RepID=UPI000CA04479|nr:substrate-binding domain-containing protein [Aquimarina sediminis]